MLCCALLSYAMCYCFAILYHTTKHYDTTYNNSIAYSVFRHHFNDITETDTITDIKVMLFHTNSDTDLNMSYHIIPYHTRLYHSMPCHTIPYYAIPYHTVHCTLYPVPCTLYSVHGTLYSLHCTHSSR